MFHDMSFMGMWWLWLIIIVAVVLILVYSVNNSRAGSSNILNETPLDLLKKSKKGLTTNEICKELRVGRSCTLAKLRKLRKRKLVEMIKSDKAPVYICKKNN